MKKKILFATTLCILLFTGCQLDNYDQPKSMLTGKIIYEGEAISVRTDATRLALWQDGYAFKTEIPVYIAQDGTYSVALFDGEYQMTRKSGAPWEEQRGDTIRINVKGNTICDVPVNPYFVIRNESYSKQGNTITAKFTIQKGVETAKLSAINLYFGKTILTDENQKDQRTSCDISTVVIGQEVTMTANVPAVLANADYLFARIGVRATASNEFCYTQSAKIQLK
ncbi:DUF3823 domain-containing protein [Bacteroides sp.]|uniref:DUF3823 domain-containing protein n=1 Tax=Bacteroides sp. TaxID=29523 RepID=UPI001B6DDD5F|nr:DUF3823 domain-containing protein [Bacteroides sp.]MBP6065324.1 DUF3823 domain-containing protein [Bacteroides sp.]MBP6067280.1 DUF3823 domain-containing protein [Bacteroides sp.]MBP6937397.1 DUF3823 domain-containing protein [Bacteroides sp.]MBP8621438.1 DUF3823 domain-containing protein [Bacteroides sp.]MBP9586185.1 DUF3823 domain-containing protein [Bacteroides sp.]